MVERQLSTASKSQTLAANSCALLQFVGLAQGIQGTFVAMSAIPGMLSRLSVAGVSLCSLFCCCYIELAVRVFTCEVLHAAGWLADRFRRDKVLKCCAVASCGELPPDSSN